MISVMSTNEEDEEFQPGFIVAGVQEKPQKNWGAQVLVALSIAGTVGGGTLAVATGGVTTVFKVALGVCIASGATLVATMVWVIRTWEY